VTTPTIDSWKLNFRLKKDGGISRIFPTSGYSPQYGYHLRKRGRVGRDPNNWIRLLKRGRVGRDPNDRLDSTPEDTGGWNWTNYPDPPSSEAGQAEPQRDCSFCKDRPLLALLLEQ